MLRHWFTPDAFMMEYANTRKSCNELSVVTVIAIAAKINLIDRGLALYGPDAQASRDLLRSELNNAVDRLWPNGHHSRDTFHASGTASGQVYASIQMLTPQSDTQQAIKTQALAMVIQLGEQRQLILEQQNNSVSKPSLALLIFALAINLLELWAFRSTECNRRNYTLSLCNGFSRSDLRDDGTVPSLWRIH